MGVIAGQEGSVGACLYVGPTQAGQWVVTDGVGQRGAIFTNRPDALRFAASCQRIASIFLVPGPINLLFHPANDEAPLFLSKSNVESANGLIPPQTTGG